ncbi:dATP/dGTP diphosphohydrolase domain-containing protein [Nocardia brasiliensis]|uniref:dATP/dGTP diphosphohydrolase domain-containing protein n=1 Tax=Nocardia brasiliensis TaxID=37326 RepID=UPI0024575943|nr:dATP/dGTP diphosphohydrolase domain-containing protein [Nocardia brasiliensis]
MLAEHYATAGDYHPGSFDKLYSDAWLWWAGDYPNAKAGSQLLTSVAAEAFGLLDDGTYRPAPMSTGCITGGFDLIPPRPLWMLAEHYGRGAEKYTERDDDGIIIHDGAENWRLGYDWRLSFASLNRHLGHYRDGEHIDADTGSPHLIAVAWHAFTLLEFSETHPEFDTRLTTIDQRAAREVKAAA